MNGAPDTVPLIPNEGMNGAPNTVPLIPKEGMNGAPDAIPLIPKEGMNGAPDTVPLIPKEGMNGAPDTIPLIPNEGMGGASDAVLLIPKEGTGGAPERIRRPEHPEYDELLIAAAHLPSKRDLSDESQVFEAVHFARLIEDAEKHCGHQRTVVIGDLNMNPFEAGMVAASGGLHAVGSRRVAERERRTVHQQAYGFFYNPMWAHFGDRGETAGTYYYESGEPLCYFWNMFDQVLLRPALLDGFSHDQVRIVTAIGQAPLLRDGCPDKEMVSDHLPVVVEISG